MSAVAEQKQLVQGGEFLIADRTPDEVFTPEDFTEEHRMIAETTRQFIDNEVSPRLDELEKHDWKLARELVSKAADLGLVGVNIPEEYGGLGLDQTSGALVGENIGRCASFATTLGAESGIGHMIMDSQRLLDTGQMIFGIVCIGVIGLVSDLLFKWTNQRLWPWAF